MSIGILSFSSKYLHTEMRLAIVLPDQDKKMTPQEFYRSGKKYKVCWFLNGTNGSSEGLVYNTKARVYAEERDLVLVSLNVKASDFTEWKGFGMGFDAWRYLTDEVMPMVYGLFPMISQERCDNFIAGMSMGGRGTMKYALAYPEKFAGAAILSGSIRNYRVEYDIPEEQMDVRTRNVLKNAGGLDAYCDSLDCPYEALEKVEDYSKLPKLFFSFGTEDPSFARYCDNKERYRKMGIEAEYLDVPGLGHEARCLDIALEQAFEYFGIHKKQKPTIGH